jgi:exodeoxyribonuclease VII small subunit
MRDLAVIAVASRPPLATRQHSGNRNQMAKIKKKRVKTENAAGETFEEAIAALEEIVCQLEEGQLGLSESLAQYEQGVQRLKSCHQLLQKAETRIELLLGNSAEGDEETEPFEDADLSLTEKADRRDRRRTRRRPSDKPDTNVDDHRELF